MTRGEFISKNKDLMHDKIEFEGSYQKLNSELHDSKEKENKEKTAQQKHAIEELRTKIKNVESEMKRNYEKYQTVDSHQKFEKLQGIGTAISVVVALQGFAEKGIDQYHVMTDNPKCISAEEFKKETEKKDKQQTKDEVEALNDANELEKEKRREREERDRKQREFRENMERKRQEKNGYER